MSKYRVLSRPKGYDTNLYDDGFDTVNEAVRWAMGMTMGDDFLIVQVINWKAEENQDV